MAARLRKRGKTKIDVEGFKKSENSLQRSVTGAIKEVADWMNKNKIGGKIRTDKTKMSKTIYKKLNLNVTKEDEKTRSNPDGGFVYWYFEGKKHLILISEDKKQGSNDKRLAEGFDHHFEGAAFKISTYKKIIKKYNITIPTPKPKSKTEWGNLIKSSKYWNKIQKDETQYIKQSLGNAIERFAKNANFNSLMVEDEEIYPYILFGAGCDFHETETIAGRLRQGNFGKENIRDPKADFSIKKIRDNPTITIFLKSHKWNTGSYGCSNWLTSERKRICKSAMKQAIKYYYNKYHNKDAVATRKMMLEQQIAELQRQLSQLQ